MKKQIYLDYNASTPIAPEVSNAMLPFLTKYYGNPSSSHWAGIKAKNAVEKAREQIANLLGCTSEEIIFTSGGSESNNTVLKGVFYALKDKGNHIITSKIEHPAIINPCKFLESLGAEVTYVDVDHAGTVSPKDIEKAIKPTTILVLIMHANNEVGTIQPIKEISGITKSKGILFHTDAAQSVGKIPTKVNELGVDFLSIAGHKLYAPKGIGALYIRKCSPFLPLIHGAGHENGRRAGTENVLLDIALGKACELANNNSTVNIKIAKLKLYFWKQLQNTFREKVKLNGDINNSLPNTLNVSFIGYTGNEILNKMPEVAASTGSACHSGITKLSAVLQAMMVDENTGKGTVRFSLGRYSTKAEIDYVINKLKSI